MSAKQIQELDLHKLTLEIANGISYAMKQYVTYDGNPDIDPNIFADCLRKQAKKITDDKLAVELTTHILIKVSEAIKIGKDDEMLKKAQPLGVEVSNVDQFYLDMAVFKVALCVKDAVEEYDKFKIDTECFSDCLCRYAGRTANELVIPIFCMLSEAVAWR